MKKVAVLVSGGGTNLQAIIDANANGIIKNAEISLVISNKASAFALERAKKAGIEAKCIAPSMFDTRELFNKALIKALDEAEIDLVVLAGFLVIIPEEMVAKYRNRIINIHPSLIPSFCGTGYYGLKVHEKALERGVKLTGATVHFVDEGTDSGPIILQKAVEVKDDDTAESLQLRVMEEAEWKILPEAIELVVSGRVQVVEGKTVLMKNIVGLLEPTSGEILYDGRNFVAMSKKEKVRMRREMGMIFQGAALFDSLSVLENVMFPLDMFSSMTLRDRTKRAQECLARVKLIDAQDKYPGEISGGMQKRVAIARAIAKQPAVLLCDEPTGALDSATGVRVLNALDEVNARLGTCTVVITHNADIARMAHRVLTMGDGRIVAEKVNEQRLKADELRW